MRLWEEAPQTQIFGISVYTFGLYCMIGALCAAACIAILCRELKTKKGTAQVLICASFIFGLFVSRLAYALVRVAKDLTGGDDAFPFFSWIRPDIGGWSLYGMIFGVFLAAWVTSKITRETPKKLLDIVSCSIPLAIAAERFSEKCMEVFNISRSFEETQFPANTFLAVKDPDYGDFYLLTYLYCAAAAVILFLVLVFVLTRRNTAEGDAWLLFMILCGAGGVILASLRNDSFMEISFVKMQQVAAAGLLVWGVAAAGKQHAGARKKLYRAALISLPAVIAICIGIEFALDKTTVSHVLLYLMMIVCLAVPVVLGVKLLRNSQKGTKAA